MDPCPRTNIRPLPANPKRALADLRAADSVLARVIDTVGPFALRDRAPGLRGICHAIIGQQLSLLVAARICGRFDLLFDGEGDVDPAHLARATDGELRAVGLSRAKMIAVRGLAAFWMEHGLGPEKIRSMDDADLIDTLTRVKGIGPWTVRMVLIFNLRRPDVLPVEDLGLRMGMQKIYDLDERPGAATIERIAEPWRPWRTVATWYCWESLKETPPPQ